MNRPASLASFFGLAVAWFLALTILWMQVSAWTSYPAASIAHIVLSNGAGHWVRSIHKAPGRFEVETRIAVDIPGKGQGELVAEADPAHHAYGLPLFLALLLASGSPYPLRRALAGYVILLAPQAFSVTFDILKQIIVAGGNHELLGIARWQMESIALGYQFGTLLLPTLAPVALWLWLDRAFFAAVIADGWLRKAAAG